MKIKSRLGWMFLVVALPFMVVQKSFADDYLDEISEADQKVILAQYEDAKKIYKKIISSSDSSVVEAYAHYKLGSLYKRQNELAKAKDEYKKGLLSLKKAGEANHQIGKHLAQALQAVG